MIPTNKYSVRMSDGLLVLESIKPSPVIVSVPHDGLPYNSFSGIYQPRMIGYRGRDLNVWPLAKDIALSVEVNAIKGLMPRTLIDYNRAWPAGINYYPLTQKEVHTALDDKNLLPFYQSYHSEIDSAVSKAITEFGKEKVLLVDLHGFSKQPPYAPKGGYDLILGTGNRKSILHGDIDKRLAHHMASLGYCVFLPKDLSVGPEEDYYSADFTTRHHSEKHDINVIQIEVFSRFRMKDSLKLGQKLSNDFAEFIRLNF